MVSYFHLLLAQQYIPENFFLKYPCFPRLKAHSKQNAIQIFPHTALHSSLTFSIKKMTTLPITKFTKITPPDKANTEFGCSDALNNSANNQPNNLSSIHELATEKLLTVKGKVVNRWSKENPDNLEESFKSKILWKENPAYFKIVLWDKNVDTFNNLKVKLSTSIIFIHLNQSLSKQQKLIHFRPYFSHFSSTLTPPLPPRGLYGNE